MIGIEKIINDALVNAFASDVAVDATYTPATGDPVECRVIFEERGLYNPPGMEAQVFQRATTITARVDELGRIPVAEETFTIGSTTYTVQAPPEYDGVLAKMVVK